MTEISLRPYNGKLYHVTTVKAYNKARKKLFKTPDVIECNTAARMTGGEGKDGMWTYLVYADKPHLLAHEMAHVVFHVFERCNIRPGESDGEAFCYLLSQLMLDAQEAQ